MNKFKEVLIKFAHSNPSLFQNDDTNSYPRLIEQRIQQFFPDFQTPNHPPYAAMIHKAIWELNEKGGSSEESISNYIKQEYVDLPWAHSTLLKHHLEKLCDREEIQLTQKQRYSLGVTDLDPISNSRSVKRLKRKHSSVSGKKSRRKHKKYKSRQDSESGVAKEQHQLDLQETSKPVIEGVQEQDQVLERLDEVADEQKDILSSGLHEPPSLNIEDEKRHQGNDLVGICIQEVEEGVINKVAAPQYQSDIKIDGVSENAQNQCDVDDNENQSFEQPDVEEQKQINGTTRKQKLKSKTSSNLVKKHEINETKLQIVHIPEHSGKRVCTRSQLKMKKDASSSSELTESPGYANTPNNKLDVEFLYEEKQQETQIVGRKKEKWASSAVSIQINGQRSKLRSSRKSTSHLETEESLDVPVPQMEQQKSRSPIGMKLEPRFTVVDETTAEVQEEDDSEQDQKPDELEDQLKCQVSGRNRSAAIPKGRKAQSTHTKAKQVQDKVLRNSKSITQVKQSHKHHKMHTMTRRSSGKKKRQRC